MIAWFAAQFWNVIKYVINSQIALQTILLHILILITPQVTGKIVYYVRSCAKVDRTGVQVAKQEQAMV